MCNGSVLYGATTSFLALSVHPLIAIWNLNYKQVTVYNEVIRSYVNSIVIRTGDSHRVVRDRVRGGLLVAIRETSTQCVEQVGNRKTAVC